MRPMARPNTMAPKNTEELSTGAMEIPSDNWNNNRVRYLDESKKERDWEGVQAFHSPWTLQNSRTVKVVALVENSASGFMPGLRYARQAFPSAMTSIHSM